MKVFLVVAALVAVAAAEVSLHAVFQAKWNSFKASHGKAYHKHDEPKRMQAFLQNTHHVESHNEMFHKGQVGFALAHNEFSDMSHEEFKSKMMGFRMPSGGLHASRQNVTEFQVQANMQMPAGCDWRHTSPKVKNQGSCGSCYSFSALGALEGALMRKTGRQYDLSEQNVVDCSGPQGNYGCDGGFMTSVFQYVQKNGGVNHQAHYPYEGVVRSCRYNAYNPREVIRGYANVPYGSEAGLAQALAQIGPIAVAVDANPRSFMMYSRGVYDDVQCNPNKLSHAVLAVGYGVDNGKEYYLVKNSWGTGWGEGGYFRIAKGKNMCGICNMASYALV